MEELSLSNALLDGTIKRKAISTRSVYDNYQDDENTSSTEEGATSFPALVYSDPYKALDKRILFTPPSKKPTGVKKGAQGGESSSEKKRRHSEIVPPFHLQQQMNHTQKDKEPKTRRFSAAAVPSSSHSDEHKKNWDGVLGQLFSKRKKQDTLTRSLSWNAIHRLHKLQEEEEEKEEEATPQTFVYKPQPRVSKFARRFSPRDNKTSTESESDDQTRQRSISKSTSSEEKDGEEEETCDDIPLYEIPSVPLRNDQIPTDVYEVPCPVKPPHTKKVVAPLDPPPIKPRTTKPEPKKRASFTFQDIVSPRSSQSDLGKNQTFNKSEDIGLLKIRVIAVRIPQAPVSKEGGARSDKEGGARSNKEGGTSIDTASKDGEGSNESINKEGGASYDYSDDENTIIPLGPIAKVTPKDGLFCVLSVNGKQSQYESSLQPLNPIKQAAIWDQENESEEAIFYATHSQQVFVMSRMLPLNEVSSTNDKKKNNQPLSSRSNAECIGVGILPISTLTPILVKGDRGSVEDWTKVNTRGTEVTVPLEPHGSVLLKASYTCLQPQASVSCTGTATVTGLYGVDTFREGEACWTCCTVDIDSENCGTTSSKIGMEDTLSDGWGTEYIDFDANRSMSCRIQLWGFTSQESEYWFGEVYIPLALVLPYSRQIVHQDLVDGPLALLDSFERDITMPVEPKGHISVQFSMSPLKEEDNFDDTIKVLEESGLFKPEALAQLKSEVEREGAHKITTIPEDESLVSGVYDHLSPSPHPPPSPSSSLTALGTITRRLSKNKMTLRLLGNLQLQVPKSYDERKHKLNTEIDPFRELEIVKVELKDTKARLASSEFYREKAELKIKTLEEEIWKLKKKQKTKKKK